MRIAIVGVLSWDCSLRRWSRRMISSDSIVFHHGGLRADAVHPGAYDGDDGRDPERPKRRELKWGNLTCGRRLVGHLVRSRSASMAASTNPPIKPKCSKNALVAMKRS